jgi:hypothetical protein
MEDVSKQNQSKKKLSSFQKRQLQDEVDETP